MKRTNWLITIILITIVSLTITVCAEGGKTMTKKNSTSTANPQVIIETSLGMIQLELYADKAPITVKNFLHYVDTNFYDHTLFHRVIPKFMVQGGGFTKGMVQKQTASPIKNEAGNGLSNTRGTIAMARTPEINSATSQFFINVVDNKNLNHSSETPSGFGYCVFGKVVKGMDVVDKIVNVPTTNVSYNENVPAEDIFILSVKKVK